MPRSRIGPLALEAQLSKSGSCTTWRAVHVEARKQLAVKVFSIPFASSDDARREFAREWETLKRLRHPAIARCYGGGFDKTDAYLAYELIEGTTLTEQIERRSRMPWETVVELAENIADALRIAHDHQVIHGGLHPDKIMLTPEGDPIVLDYRTDRHGSLYRAGNPPSAFELAFQAPEVLEDPKQTSVKSDLYSLGAVIYYALTGKPPILGDDVDAVTLAVANTRPPKVATVVLDCPIWLSALVEQLLEKEPLSRPHGAPAVLLALKEIRRRTGERAGVAEHVSGGFSALQVGADKKEARSLLGKAELELDEKPEQEETSFFERPIVLIGALLALVGLAIWFMLPPSADDLRNDAETLLASEEWSDWRRAKKEYLQRLLRNHPESEHADWAQLQIDRIDMRMAELDLDMKARLGRPLEGEGERLYAEARRYEQFGDPATALDKYQAMVTLLDDAEDKDRPYVNLARRQIQDIRSGREPSSERRQLVQRKLDEAAEMIKDGRTVEARTVLQSIIELYRNNAELRPLVTEAQSMLESLSARPETS